MEDKELYTFVKSRYASKYPMDTFEENLKLYEELPCFKANENIHEVLPNEIYYDKNGNLKEEVHWIMRCFTQFYLTKAFQSMKMSSTDENLKECVVGKGTPGRIAKMWLGEDPEDVSELGSGRWNKEPSLSIFPCDSSEIVTKQVDLISCCSHHFLPFSSLEGGKVIIKYRPNKYVLGISKLQRFTNWAARRFWLQEELTHYLGEKIKQIAKTEDVQIELIDIKHGCEKYRGSLSKDGSLSTIYQSGCFKK